MIIFLPDLQISLGNIFLFPDCNQAHYPFYKNWIFLPPSPKLPFPIPDMQGMFASLEN